MATGGSRDSSGGGQRVAGAVAEEAAFGAAVSPLHGVNRDVWEGARAREWEAWAERAGWAPVCVGPCCRLASCCCSVCFVIAAASLVHCRISCCYAVCARASAKERGQGVGGVKVRGEREQLEKLV